MTALKAVLCWALAGGVALWVLWRIALGRPVIARGPMTSRAVHIAALVIVLVGARSDRAAGQPREPTAPDAGSPSTDFPATLTEAGVAAYAELHASGSSFATLGRLLGRVDEPAWARLPEAERAAHLRRVGDLTASVRREVPAASPLVALLESAAERAGRGRRHTLADLHAILDAAGLASAYEAWVGAWVWRQSGAVQMTPSQRADLLARVDRQLRVAEALERAAAQSGGVRYVPWVKKSVAPRGYRALRVPPDLAQTAEQLYPSIRLASWADEATIELVVDASSANAVLWRRGVRTALRPGGTLRLGRLDVVAAESGPLVLRHAALGRISVPPGTALHAWGVPELLSPGQRTQVQQWIARARRGDAAALRAIEASLPACHAQLRLAVAGRSSAPGAASLRTELTLFDE